MKIVHTLSIIVSLISSNLYAQDCVDCSAELKPFDDVIQNIESLETTTVVSCDEKLKENAKAEYLENFGKHPKQSALVKGVNLQGTSDELNFLTKMLGSKPAASWASAKGCKTVLCALTNVYGSEESAHRALNIAKRDGYIISAQKDFNIDNTDMGQLFSLAELRDIDLAYKKLPATFRKLKTLDRIKRLPDGYSSPKAPNAAAYAIPGYKSSYYSSEGEITFLQGTFNSDRSWGPQVAIHELSHHVDFSRVANSHEGISASAEYLKLSGWKKTQSYETDEKTGKKVSVLTWEYAKDKQFVTDYASTQPAEDFAESVAHYMFMPNKLKSVDLEKYEYIKKNVFAGKEFVQEPDIKLNNDEIYKMCIEQSEPLSIYGNTGAKSLLTAASCLENYVNSFLITDPNLCEYNLDQINTFLGDRIAGYINKASDQLDRCDQKLISFRTECINEGNFQKSCPIEKCEIDTPLKNKVRNGSYYDVDKAAMAELKNKVGTSNFLSSILINGLSGQKVTNRYRLNMQKDFVDNAVQGLTRTFENENFKFEPNKNLTNMVQNFLMMDKTTSESIARFQTEVLNKSTKSKETNLALIRAWAASQSLADTPNFEVLATTLIPHSR